MKPNLTKKQLKKLAVGSRVVIYLGPLDDYEVAEPGKCTHSPRSCGACGGHPDVHFLPLSPVQGRQCACGQLWNVRTKATLFDTDVTCPACLNVMPKVVQLVHQASLEGVLACGLTWNVRQESTLNSKEVTCPGCLEVGKRCISMTCDVSEEAMERLQEESEEALRDIKNAFEVEHDACEKAIERSEQLFDIANRASRAVTPHECYEILGEAFLGCILFGAPYPPEGAEHDAYLIERGLWKLPPDDPDRVRLEGEDDPCQHPKVVAVLKMIREASAKNGELNREAYNKAQDEILRLQESEGKAKEELKELQEGLERSLRRLRGEGEEDEPCSCHD